MGRFSIFHSEPVPNWSKSSKGLDRTDVEEEDVQLTGQRLLGQGRKVEGIIPNYRTGDAPASQTTKAAKLSRRYGYQGDDFRK